jgi:N-acetylmuramoyl-L-alanine amidase
MFLSRQNWQARKPSTALSPIGIQSTVFIHHSVTNPTGDPRADARQIQNFHMDSRKYSDIAYTLLVHPDGTVLEGRTVGGQAAQGAHTSGYNSKSIAICAIGNYEVSSVPNKLIAGINEALAYAIDKKWVTENPKIRPHSDVGFTACCGKNLKKRLNEIGVNEGEDMSADKLTEYEVKELYKAYFGIKSPPEYNFKHVGEPLRDLIAQFRTNNRALMNQESLGLIGPVDTTSKDELYEAQIAATKKVFGK